MPSKNLRDPHCARSPACAVLSLADLLPRSFTFLLFLALSGPDFAVAAPAATGPVSEPTVVRPREGPAYRADRILVLPKAGRGKALGNFHQQNHVKVVQ